MSDFLSTLAGAEGAAALDVMTQGHGSIDVASGDFTRFEVVVGVKSVATGVSRAPIEVGMRAVGALIRGDGIPGVVDAYIDGTADRQPTPCSAENPQSCGVEFQGLLGQAVDAGALPAGFSGIRYALGLAGRTIVETHGGEVDQRRAVRRKELLEGNLKGLFTPDPALRSPYRGPGGPKSSLGFKPSPIPGCNKP
jgi:hypothetical protein